MCKTIYHMRRNTTLVYVELVEMAQQLVEGLVWLSRPEETVGYARLLKDTVQFKLYSIEQITINYAVIRHMITTRQQRIRQRVLRPKLPMFPDV